MSAKLSGMVFDRYPVGGGEMLLALKLADNAHDDGTHIFPSVATMAEKTRQSERAVQYQLRRMQKSGWLILVRPARGGRNGAGYPAEYRINPDWIMGADIAPIESADTSGEMGAKIAPIESKERVQSQAEMGAICDGMGASGGRNGCKAFAPEPSVNHQVTVKNHKLPRLPSRVSVSIPEWLDPEAWNRLAAHRIENEQSGGAPWTQTLAEVTLLTLEQRRAEGHDPVACINASILGGWSGIYPPRKVATAAGPAGTAAPKDWHKTFSGIVTFGEQLGVTQRENEKFGLGLERFKARVFKAAGPGEWQEEMLRVVSRESEERGAALLAFFNDVPRAASAPVAA